ncbi:LysR family transcriptional regulator [Streptomyces sp. XD-27]|uniref:LysR family transcriptional regulator n=1 Tax=Streptomyces sp. XD-27 TaxID=3062779 RepID=UPI0026F42D93|nr:LysR family transcriptional regulator [Streptomyces sp. XD-27]WKX73105.1 LysR family transcriptional regulator [Streptomyces sp. XD-27]
MSLRQMEYLLTVVEEASFTRAADVLNVTQSALSHQIKALEREVGGELLERLPRGVSLTPMGRAFLPHAALAVRSAGQARRAARAAAVAAGGELHIATVHSVAIGVLPPVVARWRREHPGVRLVLHEYATPEELRERMERGVADVALGPRPRTWSGPVVSLGEEEIVFVLPPDDPLAGRAAVRLEDLADREWVRCEMEPVIEGRLFLDWVCEQAGFAPRTAVRTQHTSTAVRIAAAGGGIVAAPAHIAAGVECATVRVDPPWCRELTAFSRVELSGAAAAFVDGLPRLAEQPRAVGTNPSARPAPSDVCNAHQLQPG